jgi:hypothetical protein
MKFLNKRRSKAILEKKALPESILNDCVLVDFNNKISIITKKITGLEIANLNLLAVGLPLDKLA